MKHRSSISLWIAFALSLPLGGQTLTQTIRGQVIDAASKSGIPGAYVLVTSMGDQTGAVTDELGHFQMDRIPVGRHSLLITCVGYEQGKVHDLPLSSAKEIVLTISLQESILEMEELIIQADTEREKPLNDLALVSARSFTVDETKRYAASINDPARMALSFAGVSNTDDATNQIVVRGNSPKSVLWRVEGVEIPNPNHFTEEGASAGGISILSVNMLANSDFLTGAFPAEYGNALSGVFDIKLRNGNNQKREYAFQAGVMGVDLAAEGPFTKSGKSSYLINYRYSTLSLLDKIGVSGFEGFIPEFQDLSAKIHIPTKNAGAFSFWTLNGLSNQSSDTPNDSTQWHNRYDRFEEEFGSDMTASGLSHVYFFTPNTSLETVVSFSALRNTYYWDSLDQAYQPQAVYNEQFLHKTLRASTQINTKISNRHVVRAGVIGSRIDFDLFARERDDDSHDIIKLVDQEGKTSSLQSYAQWQYRMSSALTFNGGLHSFFFGLTNEFTLEPRASLSWKFKENQSLRAGYGRHSRLESLSTYFAERSTPEGVNFPNNSLAITKADHYVLSYRLLLRRDLHLNTEIYYQHLFDVPVAGTNETDPQWQTFSAINFSAGFTNQPLNNLGVGENYGIELTLEKFFTQQYYILFTQSLYRSNYTAIDRKVRPSRYDGRFTTNLLAGKEMYVGSQNKNVLALNMRVIVAGGQRTTPIDLEESGQEGEAIFLWDERYANRLPTYFRTDIRLAYTINKARTSSTLSLDIQNVTARQNVFNQYYNEESGALEYNYQLGLIPVLNYRLEF